ncbi:MAG: CCA tRNA nucleotidyltransferase, partial [Clostridia bacterium]|nr:CCA tRNA nucleotidyltransferase [Clostridia bacterium]
MPVEELVLEIARRVGAAGGRALLVGGCVRDRLLGVASKDVDLEIYGIPAATLRAVLAQVGEVYDKGAAFSVLGLRHWDIDIAMPRRESRSGLRHTDFDVTADPYLSYEDASRRRDFTINAMMLDPLTDELIDCWHGREDLIRRVIRHVADDTFGDDPLRVFRAAQFAARFEARIAPETVAISRSMDVRYLSRERVFDELGKALMKARRPSAFLSALRDMAQLNVFFPEMEAFMAFDGAFDRAMRALDAAAARRDQAIEPLNFMLAALLQGLPDAFGDGEAMADRQLRRLTNNVRALKYVKNMLALRARPAELAGAALPQSRMLLDGSVCPHDLILLAAAREESGRGAEAARALAARLEERARDFEARLAEPMVTGQDLLDAGRRPGARMKPMLDFARRLHFEGVDREEALARTLEEFAENR